MEQHVPSPSGEIPTLHSPGAAPALTGLLRRALNELKASTVGVTRANGAPPRYFTRSAAAGQFFEELSRAGLETVKEQAQARAGVFGTNRVKSHAEGPVRGRLLAVALRNARGVPLGLLIATRLIDEPSFGADESIKLLALAPEFAAAIR